MRDNRNKITKLLSCLVVCIFLVAIVPVSVIPTVQAEPIFGLPTCKLDVYGNEILKSEPLLAKEGGYGTIYVEAGISKDEDFTGFLCVRLPRSVEPVSKSNGGINAHADMEKTCKLDWIQRFYDYSEILHNQNFFVDNYGGKWYIFPIESYKANGEYGCLVSVHIPVKFTGVMQNDEIFAAIMTYSPKSSNEIKYYIAERTVMKGLELEIKHLVKTAITKALGLPWYISALLKLPDIIEGALWATGEKAYASKLPIEVLDSTEWESKKTSGIEVHDKPQGNFARTYCTDPKKFSDYRYEYFTAELSGPDEFSKGEIFEVKVNGKMVYVYRGEEVRARLFLPEGLELASGEKPVKIYKYDAPVCIGERKTDIYKDKYPMTLNEFVLKYKCKNPKTKFAGDLTWKIKATKSGSFEDYPINAKVIFLAQSGYTGAPGYSPARYTPRAPTKWVTLPCTDDLERVSIFNVGSVVDKGLDWLRDPDQQKTDGDYVYWTYKGTPNVGVTALVTLAFLNHGYDESDPTVKGALNWLVAQANEDGSISCDTRKVYDTSLAILPLVAAQNEAKYGTVKGNARNYLISVQNNEGTGYDHSDRFYGGWGYPKDNWADLSNTQFVVMALDAAGGLTGKVKDNVLTFVTRCQNRKESNSEYCSYDDGGFVYQPKSGGTSYGSMTAAGLWGLFLCGVNKGDGRLKDALQWLDHDHYSVSANTPIGNKWVYYYDLGLAKAYLMAEARGCEFGKTNWYEDLYAFLSDKQDKKDGHWHNIEGEHSCDVLATAEAILALSVKEIPAKISKLSYMVFKLRSAADLHIYDPEGRHVGLNTETGEVEIGIPDATYTENPIEIKVPNLKAGGYKAVLIGTEAGEYELDVIAKTGNKTLAEASYEGWITEGATQEMVTTISSIVGPLDVRIGTLEAVVEAEDSYSEQFSLDASDELEIDAIDETGVLLRIEAEEDCEGEVKIMDYSENPTIKGFPGEYKYCALKKYVEISLDVDREKIDWPIYLEVHYDEDELPENVDESTLTIYHYLNDTKWRSCNDFEVNPEENYISAELEKDELCYFGMGGLYAPIWVRYSMILAVIAIVIVLAVGYFSVRRFVKSRRVKAMKVPERVPAEVAITIYNFDNSFSLLKEREETAKISDGLDGRLASGEIKEETYNDLKSKYESKIGDRNRKIKSELERAKAYLQRIEDEQTKLQDTHETLNAELQKETGRKKKAEISAKVAGISAEVERVDGIIKTMKEKIGVIEVEGSGD